MSNATAMPASNPVVERRRGEAWTASALIGPATIFIAVCLLAPLAFLFRYSLNDFIAAKKMMVEAVTIANYVKFFTDPYYTTILWTTVRIAVLVTAVCLVLAFPLAYVVARTQSRFKNLLSSRSCCRCSSATPSAPPAGWWCSAARVSSTRACSASA